METECTRLSSVRIVAWFYGKPLRTARGTRRKSRDRFPNRGIWKLSSSTSFKIEPHIANRPSRRQADDLDRDHAARAHGVRSRRSMNASVGSAAFRQKKQKASPSLSSLRRIAPVARDPAARHASPGARVGARLARRRGAAGRETRTPLALARDAASNDRPRFRIGVLRVSRRRVYDEALECVRSRVFWRAYRDTCSSALELSKVQIGHLKRTVDTSPRTQIAPVNAARARWCSRRSRSGWRPRASPPSSARVPASIYVSSFSQASKISFPFRLLSRELQRALRPLCDRGVSFENTHRASLVSLSLSLSLSPRLDHSVSKSTAAVSRGSILGAGGCARLRRRHRRAPASQPRYRLRI